MIGYGVWWTLVEIMHEQGGKITRFPKLFEFIASETKQNEANIRVLINAMIDDYALLKCDDTHIWSDRVLDNFTRRGYISTQRAEAGRLGGIKSGEERSKCLKQMKQNEANEAKERKVKERKVNTISCASDDARQTDLFKKETQERFQEVWSQYPKKVDAKKAFIHFKASVKTDEDFVQIKQALANYKNSKIVQDNEDNGKYIKNGATWFNNWKDWVGETMSVSPAEALARRYREECHAAETAAARDRA